MSNSIGKKIRIIRESERLTREQFSDLTGIPASAQKFYETDRVSSVGSDTLLKITSNPQLLKYTLWLMSDLVNENAGQISPELADKEKRTEYLLQTMKGLAQNIDSSLGKIAGSSNQIDRESKEKTITSLKKALDSLEKIDKLSDKK